MQSFSSKSKKERKKKGNKNNRPLRLFQFFGIWCLYLVCGVAVPNNEFAVLGGADQKPDEKIRSNNQAQSTEHFKITIPLKPGERFSVNLNQQTNIARRMTTCRLRLVNAHFGYVLYHTGKMA